MARQVPRIETFRVKQGALVVIAQDADIHLHHQVDTLTRVRSVANNVAQAVDFGDPLLADIAQHGLESFEVAVDIADQGTFHAR